MTQHLNVKKVFFNQIPSTNRYLKMLFESEQLEVIGIQDNDISNLDLPHELAYGKSIRLITIESAQITDEGLSRMNFKHNVSYNFVNTLITEKGLLLFQNKYPQFNIEQTPNSRKTWTSIVPATPVQRLPGESKTAD